jgi:hypothetical protein
LLCAKSFTVLSVNYISQAAQKNQRRLALIAADALRHILFAGLFESRSAAFKLLDDFYLLRAGALALTAGDAVAGFAAA